MSLNQNSGTPAFESADFDDSCDKTAIRTGTITGQFSDDNETFFRRRLNSLTSLASCGLKESVDADHRDSIWLFVYFHDVESNVGNAKVMQLACCGIG